jgi:hypothetical protein
MDPKDPFETDIPVVSFNRLSPAEAERLALLMEEMGETVQVIGKILRHGYESTHPDGGPTNRGLLEKEIGDVRAAIHLMTEAKDIYDDNIWTFAEAKRQNVKKYLHHQKLR